MFSLFRRGFGYGTPTVPANTISRQSTVQKVMSIENDATERPTIEKSSRKSEKIKKSTVFGSTFITTSKQKPFRIESVSRYKRYSTSSHQMPKLSLRSSGQLSIDSMNRKMSGNSLQYGMNVSTSSSSSSTTTSTYDHLLPDSEYMLQLSTENSSDDNDDDDGSKVDVDLIYVEPLEKYKKIKKSRIIPPDLVERNIRSKIFNDYNLRYLASNRCSKNRSSLTKEFANNEELKHFKGTIEHNVSPQTTGKKQNSMFIPNILLQPQISNESSKTTNERLCTIYNNPETKQQQIWRNFRDYKIGHSSLLGLKVRINDEIETLKNAMEQNKGDESKKVLSQYLKQFKGFNHKLGYIESFKRNFGVKSKIGQMC